jgi:hypothetical protein
MLPVVVQFAKNDSYQGVPLGKCKECGEYNV